MFSNAAVPANPLSVTLQGMRPFQFTGIDYLGPIAHLQNNQKFYVLLFTCLQIRSIHLELTSSLNSEDFHAAFIRFVSRRGCPTKIRSDNAKTFISASKRLTKTKSITWQFHTQKAPWTGGAWERMVKSVKTSLRISISKVKLNVQGLETTLCEIENIINSRPLTYSTGNETDNLPLTPNNFLRPTGTCSSVQDLAFTSSDIQDIYETNCEITRKFWYRWKAEYIQSLITDRSKATGIPLIKGDIVLLNEGPKRKFWPLVKILDLIPGRDKRIRSVQILHRGKIFVRPIRLIHKLEFSCPNTQ